MSIAHLLFSGYISAAQHWSSFILLVIKLHNKMQTNIHVNINTLNTHKTAVMLSNTHTHTHIQR